MPPQHDRPRRPGDDGRPPARKRWGQHFLARPETAERIVEAARVGGDDLVLEIGPGDGALTRPLARRAARVVAVEIDPLRAERLQQELEVEPGRVAVLTGDVMQRTFRAWLEAGKAQGPAVMVANLPYNAATRILTAAIEDPSTIRRAVATVQAEVADRFLARVGDEAYGYLSIRTAAHATGRRLFDLPPAAFRPRPRVHSTVMELTPRPLAIADPGSIERALRLASLGFQARRKTLANALSSVAARAHWESALQAIGKTARARAEELSLEDFVALARSTVPA